ncbi:MAG: TasA family protein [Methanocellales archaeon]|nr:TasA family protein [Methanocellales archaeon]
MNRVIAASLTIFFVTVLVSGSTFAYFRDTETSTGNTFTAGTMDLKVSDWDEPFGDGVTATWTISNMKPGDIIGGWISLQNFGSIEADHVEIKCSNSVTDPPGPESDTEEGTTDMDEAMEIIWLTYDNSNLLTTLTDLNGNGIKDLDDFENRNEGKGFDDVTPVPAANRGTTGLFVMWLKFNETLADNDYQGDTLTTTITFTLNQDSSQ